MSTRLAFILMLTLLVGPIDAHAQRPALNADVVADTGAIHAVVVGVIHGMSWEIAAGAMATESRPWRVRVPDGTATIWKAVKSRLYEVLHARPISSADTLAGFLTFSRVTVRGDSLFTFFTVGQLELCGKRWVESGTTVELISVRSNGMWPQPSEGYINFSDGTCLKSERRTGHSG